MQEIAVTDAGIGIAPEDQEAVFEEFRQAGTTDNRWKAEAWGWRSREKFIDAQRWADRGEE